MKSNWDYDEIIPRTSMQDKSKYRIVTIKKGAKISSPLGIIYAKKSYKVKVFSEMKVNFVLAQIFSDICKEGDTLIQWLVYRNTSLKTVNLKDCII